MSLVDCKSNSKVVIKTIVFYSTLHIHEEIDNTLLLKEEYVTIVTSCEPAAEEVALKHISFTLKIAHYNTSLSITA